MIGVVMITAWQFVDVRLCNASNRPWRLAAALRTGVAPGNYLSFNWVFFLSAMNLLMSFMAPSRLRASLLKSE